MIQRIPGNRVGFTPEISGKAGNIKAYNQSAKQANNTQAAAKDSVMLSRESLSAAEVAKYAEIAKNMPDIDIERVEQAKQRIANKEYLTSDVAQETAQRILDNFEE